ncbi:MAG: inositol monophosphatase family protein, partial [Deltaproteobacteria bacterium]
VVYAPATGTLWFGSRELGAYRRDSDGRERSIRVGGVEKPAEALITISRSRRSEPLSEALRRIAPRVVVPMGSAGLKGSLVAEATADAYLAIGAAGKHWDACALEALVNAAGGRVTDARGLPLNYRSEGMDLEHGLLVSNQSLHGALLARLTATH